MSLVATPFVDATVRWLGATPTEGWSNKIELCDADNDGDVDAFVANGAAYSEADLPELPFFWRNTGSSFVVDELPVPAGWWRVVKCADIDGDGDSDVFFGGTFQSRSFLALNVGAPNDQHFVDGSDRLPDDVGSFGDAEFADVDGDGRQDLVLADWGSGDPLGNGGAQPRLWMQRGEPGDPWFVDESASRLPATKAGFSWDIEAIDVDDDLDLDLLVACKVCRDGGLLLKNQLVEEGNARFVDTSGALPGSGNNYDFEPIDIDGDGDLDLFTVNDGPNLGERLLKNNGGVFTVDADAFAAGVNSAVDDNAAFVLDVDGDGDEDVFVASLSGDDRVLNNVGGVFASRVIAVDGARTRGSLAAAAGDLDGDGRLDLVMGQGESEFDDLVYEGRDVVVDTLAPTLSAPRIDRARRRLLVRAWDHVSPVRDVDLDVTASFTGASADGNRTAVLARAGERYWQTGVLPGDASVVVCAVDRRGNEACSDVVVLSHVVAEGEGEGDVVGEGEGEVAREGEAEVCDDNGCGDGNDDDDVVITTPSHCASASPPLFIALIALLGSSRRRRFLEFLK